MTPATTTGTTTATPLRRRLAMLGIAAATLAVPAAVAIAATTSGPADPGRATADTPTLTPAGARPGGGNQDPCAPAWLPSTPPAPPSAAAPTAAATSSTAGTLAWLAGHLQPAPADTRTGPYTVITYRHWAADLAGNGNQRGTTKEVVEDHARVIAADGSGHETVIRYPAGTSNPSPGMPGTRIRTEVRGPGGFRDGIAPPIGTDPSILASQINTVQPWENGPFAGLRAIADTAIANTLPCQTRAAALEVLTSMGGHDSGPAVDRAGRPGIAITVDSEDGGVRDTLIIDARTGVVLAYELRLLRNPGRLRGTFPRTENYVLLLTSDRSDTAAMPTG